ncbi:MAG: hypothetical protein HC833_05840 [Leptolyngbyaceae cyanobacterium RM1_406_9]|nr:hypothetical protein [Leptolyngbyaceae cyanobacterium RM1_406_9]
MLERTDSHDPAFPLFCQHIEPSSVAFYGLTKREYFAAMAMQGLIAADTDFEKTALEVSRWAVSQADSLIERLNETVGESQ